MMTFRGDRLATIQLPPGTAWLLDKLAESRKRQALYVRRSSRLLRTLQETAIIEGTASSNRIDGVTVEPERLRPLVLCDARPRDRSEEEIVGYANGLRWVYANADSVAVTPETLKCLHSVAMAGTIGDAGEWKETQNEIVELDPEGQLDVRFCPVEPARVPAAVEELCRSYRESLDRSSIPPLLAVAGLVFDFLCIHPFREGNGRISRLLTLLVLYQHGYMVGRYISLERIVEQTRESYYAALRASSLGWHDGRHDIMPWFHYFVSTLHAAYDEFERCVGY
ncbi:MAG TPA: Fic family protein [candidate division Zixibacteria bacterium]|nr:Fic family protein [candidate division Zixibacteria bacterium]